MSIVADANTYAENLDDGSGVFLAGIGWDSANHLLTTCHRTVVLNGFVNTVHYASGTGTVVVDTSTTLVANCTARGRSGVSIKSAGPNAIPFVSVNGSIVTMANFISPTGSNATVYNESG